jgi:16S rRNA (uracil1498-N3)-methyltransferase
MRSGEGLLLLPYESAGDDASTVAEAVQTHKFAADRLVSIFIGPEGGFEDGEIALASSRATIVTMGSRVLRSETAGLVAVTLVLEACGELG